jgi:hypothetical protein
MSSVALGDFEVSLVRESIYWWDGGAFFGVVPKTMWSARVPADELNRIPAGFNSYLIRTGEHVILIETGGGDKMNPRARERMKLPPIFPVTKSKPPREPCNEPSPSKQQSSNAACLAWRQSDQLLHS